MLSALAVPDLSLADVRIQLRNGSVITADDCTEETDRLVCFKMGGSFEIDKKDMVSVTNIKTGSTVEHGIESGEQKPAANNGTADGAIKKPGPGNEKEKIIQPSPENDPLVRKAAELQAERERLITEKQKLDEDIKNAPVWMPTDQFDSLQRRSTEMEQKIKKFNEETQRLKEESSRRQPVPAK